MLQHKHDMKKYVEATAVPEVKEWWARNAESHGDVANALKYYEQIGDIISQVRVNCLAGNLFKVVVF